MCFRISIIVPFFGFREIYDQFIFNLEVIGLKRLSIILRQFYSEHSLVQYVCVAHVRVYVCV